ncbi:hypothetical protein [Membranihabitans marinus]|nr:hypothetical protein [Membranihabitans marinus]
MKRQEIMYQSFNYNDETQLIYELDACGGLPWKNAWVAGAA